MTMKTKKIVIKSTSGFCPVDYAYSDKLTIMPNSIAYEYKPYLEDDNSLNAYKKWSYKTTNSIFSWAFEKIAVTVDEILSRDQEAIPKAEFNSMRWRYEDYDTNAYYLHIINSVKIRYYPGTRTLYISGKIILLLADTRVLNLDDVYGIDIERFISDVNNVLNRLFTRVEIDIRDFTLSRIDYCFNVKTPMAGVPCLHGEGI